MAHKKDREIRIAYRHELQAPVFTLKRSGVCEKYGLNVSFHHPPTPMPQRAAFSPGNLTLSVATTSVPLLTGLRDWIHRPALSVRT